MTRGHLALGVLGLGPSLAGGSRDKRQACSRAQWDQALCRALRRPGSPQAQTPAPGRDGSRGFLLDCDADSWGGGQGFETRDMRERQAAQERGNTYLKISRQCTSMLNTHFRT